MIRTFQKIIYCIRNIGVLCLILFFSNQLQAQDFKSRNHHTGTGIKTSYLGSVIYPGFSLGIDRPYKITEVNKRFMKKPLAFYKERYYGLSINMYHHSDFHTNLFVLGEWTNRRQYNKGLYIESTIGLGLSRTFIDGATFEVTDSGEIRKVSLAGSFYGLGNIAFALGYNFGMKGNTPFNVFLKPGALLFFPFNNDWLERYTIQTGFIVRLNNFWKASPSYSIKGSKTN